MLLAASDLVHHLNLIFLLGLAVFGGTVGAKLFQKLRIPQVVGYIVIGIIGFMIGGELKYDVLKKHGKHFLAILLSEGLSARPGTGRQYARRPLILMYR